MEYLEFEQPLAELESQIETLRKSTDIQEVAILQAVEKLKQKQLKLTQKIFSNLTDWQVIQLARHPERPYALDYIERVFTDFQELHGDRAFADDAAIVGGLARLNNEPVVVIGQQKGRDTKQKLYRNFGMPHPEGYRKALRLMHLAERFHLPVITLIDTPGAYPGIQAEARGQSEAIARNLREMAGLKVPVISVVIGEGCSGGALGIGVSDVFLMMQYSYFATISPEGCATILWKSADQAAQAAEIMGITAQKLQALKLVEGIVPEPLGGAHRDFAEASNALKTELIKQLKALRKLPEQVLLENRYQRLMTFGKFGTR